MNPNYSKYWLYQICGWGSLALISILLALSYDKLNVQYISRILIFIALGVAFTHGMRWVIKQVNLLMKSLHQQIIGFIILTFAATIIMAGIEIFTFNKLNLEIAAMERFGVFRKLVTAGFNSFVYLFIWNCIYCIYHYAEKSRKQQLETMQLESMLKELNQKTIKEQIDPHYIFNALNGIQTLVVENPEKARIAITELSNSLRTSMQVGKLIKKLMQFFSR